MKIKIFLTVILLSKLIFSQADSSLIISEIMFNPNGSNTEFIEIYNISETDTIDLNNYKFKYYTSTADVIMSAGFGTSLPPKSFAVVLEGDYDFVSGIYNSLIPNSALILKISDNSFGASGMANTTDRPLALLRPNNDTLEIKIYTSNNSTGFSDEKRVMNKDTTVSNWGNSSTNNGTPGYKNSITPLVNDISVSTFSLAQTNILLGNSFNLRAMVKNLGTNSAQNVLLKLYYDENSDNIPTPNEIIHQENINSIFSGDSIDIQYQYNPTQVGNYRFIAVAEYTSDENLNNNSKSVIGSVQTPSAEFNAIVINEIMYAPTTGEPEWVEIFNRSANPINLKNWKIKDNSTSQATISTTDLFLQPDSFLVISNNISITNFYNIPSRIVVTSFPALNNTDDAVVIKDSSGFIIDSLYYFSSWGGSSGRSLERVFTDSISLSQSNWKTSSGLIKATPGRKNSVTPKNFDLSITSFKTDKKYVIGDESIELKAWIKNPGIDNSAVYSVKFYNDVNNDSIPTASELFTEMSGITLIPNDSVSYLVNVSNFTDGINRFIVRVDATIDEDSSNNTAFTSVQKVIVNEVRSDIIINEIMYAPTTGEPEWIEIYNNSSKIINLKNYRFADAVDTVTINTVNLLLQPNEYLVITKDSSVAQFYNISSKIVKATLPTLNNDFDKVILMDSLNRVIDSLRYVSNWGGNSGGRSLERISFENSSTDSLNWKTSIGVVKATPGKINSVTQKDYDLAIISAYTSPAFPIFGDNLYLYTKVKNTGKNNLAFSLSLFEDTDFDSTADINLYTSSTINISAGDSLSLLLDYQITNLQSTRQFIISVSATQDDDTTNNKLVYSIRPGYPQGSIIVNEIMYTPAGGEPEWIEIKNVSDKNILIKDWAVSDILTTPLKVFIRDSIIISPDEVIVIARDSTITNYHRIIPSRLIKISLPNLNNDADGIVIYDGRGAVIDSILYSSTWGGLNGYSLERISVEASTIIPTNWGTSIDIEQSTPGRVNSISQKQIDLTFSGLQFNPPFPKLDDNVTVVAKVRNTGIVSANSFSVIFRYQTDSLNAPLILLDSVAISGLNSFDSIEVTSRNVIQQLNYKTIITTEIFSNEDEDIYNNIIQKNIEPGFEQKSLLITEIMYDPKNNEPEWVELYNPTIDTVNLKNWFISDLLTTPTKVFLTTNDYLLTPHEHVVVARDTNFTSFYPGQNIPLIKAVFGSLSNTTDGIYIYDFRNAIIDSVIYKSAWGGRNGFSLERIDYNRFSNDSSNWATSLKRATPGSINSVETVPSYSRNQLLINEIMYEPDIDNNEFVEIFNNSNDSINIGGWRIEDEKKNFYRLSDTSIVIPPKNYFVLMADSLVLNKYSNLKSYPHKSITNVSNLGLVNTGELVLLKDIRGNIIDSVFYSDKWHNRQISNTRNRSIERINPDIASNNSSNWSSSVSGNGATPGIVNSIFADNTSRNKALTVEPNPFSPDNDGFEDFTIINYNLTQAVAQVRVKIFDSKGRQVRTLANNIPSSNQGSIIFDGRDDGGNALRVGIYIVFLEAVGNDNNTIETLKTVVVVARKF
jgi:hypothetical protein